MHGWRVAVPCLVAVIVAATAEQCDEARANIIRNGIYNPGSDPVQCVDPCDETGYMIVNQTECFSNAFCHWNGTNCIIKTVRNRHRGQSINSAINALLDDLDGRVQGRNLNIFGPGGPGNPFGGCQTFPDNCNINPFDPQLFTLLDPPLNIPYCRRIPCTTSNPTLDVDHLGCISVPGCFFDAELANIRHYYGHSILPGVPVCHLVIRNKEFQRLANEQLIAHANRWNALWTNCLIDQNRDKIIAPMPGCYGLELLLYVGIQPKQAGWTGITSEECYLIDGCYHQTLGCVHPLRENRVTIRSGTDDHRSQSPTGADIFGQPECIPFADNAEPADYLNNYHSCMQSGCAVDPSITNSLQRQLQNITLTYVPARHQRQYWQMVASNAVGPDNWKEEADKLITGQRNHLNNLFSSTNFVGLDQSAIASILSRNPGGIHSVPFSLPVNHNGQSFVPNPSLPFINPNQIPGLPIPGVAPFVPNPAQQLFYFPQEPTCPYQPANLFGFPPLRGSFTDCCKRSRCYQPRASTIGQYSGVSNYFASWEPWGTCSVTCGGGVQERRRRCVAYKRGESCDGLDVQTSSCNNGRCPEWLGWSSWSECTSSCGGGTQTRARACDRTGCSGNATDSRPCNSVVCPVFGEWTAWSECSNSCGVGSRIRWRTCDDSDTPLSCPEQGDPEVTETSECSTYCGRISKISETSCAGHPTCAITKRYRCEYTDPDGHASSGHCRDFRPMRKTRCVGDFRCRFCGIFPGYCFPV